MEEKTSRRLRTFIILAFIAAVFSGLVYSRIVAFSLAPTMRQVDFSGLTWWQVPIAYVWDYISHAWICLLFAFTLAGLISELAPKQIITNHMRSKNPTSYLIASGLAAPFTVCSCTMVPLFAGILYAGSGIGPAVTFLLMAPASNIMTILLTGEILSWNIALTRIIASFISAVTIGVLISKTPWGLAIEKERKTRVSASTVKIVNPPFDERLYGALKFAGFLAKRILPFLLLGVVAVSYLVAYLPEEAVAIHLTGVSGVILGSVIGGPLYTPTLVEIVLAKGLMDLGMSSAATLSFLMGQPYDVPNMIATSRIVRWKVVLAYAVFALIFSIISGLLYGIATGGL